MELTKSDKYSGSDVSELFGDLKCWQQMAVSSIDAIKTISVTTEDEFLAVGAKLQEFYERSSEINSIANSLLETLSGESSHAIVDRLQSVLSDMEVYISNINVETQGSCTVLGNVLILLDNISQPLEGFQKMYKTLRMLGISTKIESSRIGEKGVGFLTLARDVERLSLLVNEKSSNILARSSMLARMIADNIRYVNTNALAQINQLVGKLKNTEANLKDLLNAYYNCSRLGETLAGLSVEASQDIGSIVSSLQSHDITRQQLEHVVEALETLVHDIEADSDGENIKQLVVEAGDVCELQSAMLGFATSELINSMKATVDSLQHLSENQKMMTSQTEMVMSIDSNSGSSFIENISAGMSSVMDVLGKCVQAEQELSKTMTQILSTIGDVSGFVADIEEIGSEIDLIALNSQIMAAHTGIEGAALGVLAEAIKRLSLEAFTQTEVVAGALSQINGITGHILEDIDRKQSSNDSNAVVRMTSDFKGVIAELDSQNIRSSEILDALYSKVAGLTEDIERTAAGVTSHQTSRQMAEKVLTEINRIVEQARKHQPASPEFLKNLKHMESRYTMNSERRIHEAIARRHDKQASVALVAAALPAGASDDSEFGENVDLF